MQEEGARRSQQVVDAEEASKSVMALYEIIADAEIDRELETTTKDWAVKKVEAFPMCQNSLHLKYFHI